MTSIPGKINNTVYSIYTDYESEHAKPHTTLPGCKVLNPDTIPRGMIGKSPEDGNQVKPSAKGYLRKGLIVNKWVEIWEMNLERVFPADFDVLVKSTRSG